MLKSYYFKESLPTLLTPTSIVETANTILVWHGFPRAARVMMAGRAGTRTPRHATPTAATTPAQEAVLLIRLSAAVLITERAPLTPQQIATPGLGFSPGFIAAGAARGSRVQLRLPARRCGACTRGTEHTLCECQPRSAHCAPPLQTLHTPSCTTDGLVTSAPPARRSRCRQPTSRRTGPDSAPSPTN